MGTETGIRGYGTYRDSSRYGALRERDPRQTGRLEEEQETRPSIARRTGYQSFWYSVLLFYSQTES